ncbi:MAG: ABC transporter ATP-binding protein [Eubacterium sp.]|nr:ABC transporter ATP-binding protein [Eubacterium sp.]
MNILETKNLTKVYGKGETAVTALDRVTVAVERGEFVAVVGTSGSGKTTFLNMLGGLDVPTDGKIIVDGRELQTLTDDELTVFRRRNIGFIFQQYNLIPMLNVWENIILPLKMDGSRPDQEYLMEIVRMLGIYEKLTSTPQQLSGGQQQRVAIARALAVKPALVLADEPTGNLDSRTSQDVLGLLKIMSTRLGQTVVMITHNEEIAQLADRILRIEDGKLAGANAQPDRSLQEGKVPQYVR